MAKRFQIKGENQAVVTASLDSATVGADHYLYLELNGEIVLSVCSDGTGELFERDISAALGNKTHLTTVHK
jgi:hypothetical protein